MSGIPHEAEPGSVAWRDTDGHKHSPIYSGMDVEDGAWRAEREEAFRASGLSEDERLLFERGWRAGSAGKGPAVWSDERSPAWVAGWEAYPRKTWEDPYASFDAQRSERERLAEQDEVTRKLRAQEAKRGAQRVRPHVQRTDRRERVPESNEGAGVSADGARGPERER